MSPLLFQPPSGGEDSRAELTAVEVPWGLGMNMPVLVTVPSPSPKCRQEQPLGPDLCGLSLLLPFSPFCSEWGCPSTGFWLHKQEGRSAHPKEAVRDLQLLPTPCSGWDPLPAMHTSSASAMSLGFKTFRLGCWSRALLALDQDLIRGGQKMRREGWREGEPTAQLQQL